MWIKPSKLSFLVVTGILLGVFIAPSVSAQEQSRGITVSPLIFELSANPGDDLTEVLNINNPTDQELDLSIDVRNFVAVGEEGQPSLTEEDTTFSLAQWIEATPSEFTIPAKESRKINFTIDTPPNAEPGGHFGSIVIKTTPSNDKGNVAIVQEVGALVLLKVAGDLVEEASIETFTATPNFSENSPIDFLLRLSNNGNVHYKPTSSVTITDMFGREVGKAQFDRRNVLPDSIRKFQSEWKPGLLFGRYTATATVVYGSNNQVIHATTTFWGFPTKLALIIGIPLLIIGVLAFLSRDRIKRSTKVLFGKNPPEGNKQNDSDAKKTDSDSTGDDKQNDSDAKKNTDTDSERDDNPDSK